jgi:hypothetical protein
VNAITKSGTNTPSGTVSSYFRHDRFNAANPIVGYVLPYSNQAVSTLLWRADPEGQSPHLRKLRIRA